MRPGMSDGRCFTTYIPNFELNRNMQKANGVFNNRDWRIYVQQNGDKVKDDFSDACKNKTKKECGQCFIGIDPVNITASDPNYSVQPYDSNPYYSF